MAHFKGNMGHDAPSDVVRSSAAVLGLARVRTSTHLPQC